MKKVCFLFCLYVPVVHATSVTIFNKSKDSLLLSLSQQPQSAQKYRIQPRRSHKFTVEIKENQPLHLIVEQGSHYWPQQFELAKMCPGQLVLKRNSAVVSSKFSKASGVVAATPIKIGYFGKNAAQDIAFLK